MISKRLAMGMVFGLGIATASVNYVKPMTAYARKPYTTTPVSLRGKWISHRDSDGYSQYLNIAKYSFYINGFHYGKQYGVPEYMSGKKAWSWSKHNQLIVSKKSPRGYYTLAKDATDAVWRLKKTRHNGRVVLKSWYYNLGDSVNPVGVSYYYRYMK